MTPLGQATSAAVSAGLPTLTVLVSLLINNQRLSDFEKRVSQRFDEQGDVMRSEVYRVEQVLDARLKHLGDFVTVPETFQDLTGRLGESKPVFVLAELNDLLTAAAGDEIEALAIPQVRDPYLANYVAAMVELAAHRRAVYPPDRTPDIPPLREPVFAVPWLSLRAHLVLKSPVRFRRRNIFNDSSPGARV